MLPSSGVATYAPITEARPHGRMPALRSVRRIAVATLFTLTSAPVMAASLDLLRLQVFVRDSLHGQRSDYQGPTAAGGSIDLSDFAIEGDLIAGNAVRFVRGQVRGFIRAPVVRREHAFASRSLPAVRGELSRVSTQLGELGRRLACAPATTVAHVTHSEMQGQPMTVIRITTAHDIDVVDLRADDLVSEGPDRLRLVLNGSATSRLVIRIHGDNATLRDVGFATRGGLAPGQVVFSFPDARHLTVVSSGGAVGDDGSEWGIPGSIVAPQAELTLAAATITGQVFGRSIISIEGLPSAQINRLGPQQTGSGAVTPSAVMQDVETAPAFVCGSQQARAFRGYSHSYPEFVR